MRKLKSQGGVAKERIDVKVRKLLELKGKLGISPATKGKKKKTTPK